MLMNIIDININTTNITKMDIMVIILVLVCFLTAEMGTRRSRLTGQVRFEDAPFLDHLFQVPPRQGQAGHP